MTIAPAPTEAEFQQHVLELAHLLGWRHLHVRRSIGKGRRWVTATNCAWPDLFLWSERHHRLLAVELKTNTGTITPEQQDVLDSLAAAGLDTRVWRPRDFDEIQTTLTGQEAQPA